MDDVSTAIENVQLVLVKLVWAEADEIFAAGRELNDAAQNHPMMQVESAPRRLLPLVREPERCWRGQLTSTAL